MSERCEERNESRDNRLSYERKSFLPSTKLSFRREEYRGLLSDIAATLQLEQISEISLGTFRLNSGYFKQMKKSRPDSRLLHQRYEDQEGVVSLPKAQEEEVLLEVATMARNLFPSEKIYSHYMPRTPSNA